MEQELMMDENECFELMPDENEWLDTKGVARYLGISRRQASKYLNQYPPPWPYYLVTTIKKVTKKADLDAWLETRKIEAAVPRKF